MPKKGKQLPVLSGEEEDEFEMNLIFSRKMVEIEKDIERELERQGKAGENKKGESYKKLKMFKHELCKLRRMWRHRKVEHHIKAFEPYSDMHVTACGSVLDRKTSIQTVLPRTAESIAEAMEKQKLVEASNCIFELLVGQNKNKERASLLKLLRLLKHFGLQENDPRLKSITAYISSTESNQEEDSHKCLVTREQFSVIIAPCLQLVGDTIRNQSVIPNWTDFVETLRIIFEECKSITKGEVATYIPQLKRQDPNWWGVAVCSVDGQRVSFGDAKKNFCLQSVSKAFNYAIVSSDIGPDEVHKYVGYEPSGRLFNEICLDSTGKPHNPMINAGAIVVTSLIREDLTMADRFDYILHQYRRLSAGEHVGFDNATFLSERDTADRNYALSYYMKENKCFPKMKREEVAKLAHEEEKAARLARGENVEPEDPIIRKKGEQWKLREELDLYFQLCSLEANCESASVMAATLANGGVNPLTRERIIDSQTCRNVLSLMYSCGMYDYSGKFSFSVGLPAKSGVSGAMVVVIPNVAGFCLFSPPLDPMGNTVRGVKFCQSMVQYYNFHNYDSVLNVDEKKKDPRRNGAVTQTVEPVMTYLYAAKHGDLDYVKRHHSQGFNMTVKDYDDRTALHIAAADGSMEVVKYLVEKCGLPMTAKDRWRQTPLDEARNFHHEAILEYLLEKYAEDSSRRERDQQQDKESGLGQNSEDDLLLDEEDLEEPLPLNFIAETNEPNTKERLAEVDQIRQLSGEMVRVVISNDDSVKEGVDVQLIGSD